MVCSCWNNIPSNVVGRELSMSSNLDLLLILQYPHCYITTGRHGILVDDWLPDLCMQRLLDHVRLSIGETSISSRFVVSVSVCTIIQNRILVQRD